MFYRYGNYNSTQNRQILHYYTWTIRIEEEYCEHIGNSLIRSTYDMDAYYYSEITKRNTKNLENREQMKTKG